MKHLESNIIRIVPIDDLYRAIAPTGEVEAGATIMEALDKLFISAPQALETPVLITNLREAENPCEENPKNKIIVHRRTEDYHAEIDGTKIWEVGKTPQQAIREIHRTMPRAISYPAFFDVQKSARHAQWAENFKATSGVLVSLLRPINPGMPGMAFPGTKPPSCQ
jgi:hypothetical protein